MRIISIGEILWDVIGGKEYLGGAPFNFCAHAVQLGHEVKFLSAVGKDERGVRARQEAERLGVETDLLADTELAETGVSYVSNEGGDGRHRLPRPAAYDFVSLTGVQFAEMEAWKPNWLYFGTLIQMTETVRILTRRVAQAVPAAKKFYDVNLRPNNYSDSVVCEMLAIADIIKLNEEEVPELGRMTGGFKNGISLESCRAFAGNYSLRVVCITRGPLGSIVYQSEPEEYVESAGFQVAVRDTIGAGDAFSAALVHGLSQGWDLASVCTFANRVGALVASRSGATPVWTIEDALSL